MTTVAVFAGLYPPAINGGGPIRSTEAMVEAVPLEFLPVVITNDHDLGERERLAVPANVWTSRGRAKVHYSSARSIPKLIRGFSAVKRERPRLLHFNSFFSPGFTIFPLMLWRVGFWGKPILLLAPRGEFGEGASGRRALKKRLYIALFRLLGIHRSIIWHSTAEHETQDIRRVWGKTAKVVLRENHTLLPLEPRDFSRKPNQEPCFAFLGRIVEHKGLAVVLQALAGTTAKLSLDIYGPEEDPTYVSRCRDIVATMPMNVKVTFSGAVHPDQVRETLAKYDALLMPTAGENFGHVIAESLSVSCPVFTTPYTPWTETLQSGGGYVVENRAPGTWLTAIEHFVAVPPEARAGIRKAAGAAYRSWRAQPEKPHVWTLAMQLDQE